MRDEITGQMKRAHMWDLGGNVFIHAVVSLCKSVCVQRDPLCGNIICFLLRAGSVDHQTHLILLLVINRFDVNKFSLKFVQLELKHYIPT